MKWSRREFPFLLPAFAAAQTSGRKAPLPANAFRHEDLAARKSGAILVQQILKGDTHTGYQIDLHESELPAGEAPHPPHHHVHEELLAIREGLLEVTIGGKSTRLGPGSVAYLASNQEHGWRNVGTTTATYFVLALGDDKA
jgi:quercetin dioxygenase-like cupin family protein